MWVAKSVCCEIICFWNSRINVLFSTMLLCASNETKSEREEEDTLVTSQEKVVGTPRRTMPKSCDREGGRIDCGSRTLPLSFSTFLPPSEKRLSLALRYSTSLGW